MLNKQLFETALYIFDPWFIKDIDFDAEKKRLDIYIDFHKGSLFYYESKEDNVNGTFKAYDTKEKHGGISTF